MACSLEHPNQGLDAPKCPPIQGPESKRDRRSKQEYLSEEVPERIHMQVVTLSWAPAHKKVLLKLFRIYKILCFHFKFPNPIKN